MVADDGSAQVTEVIDYDFGLNQKHGIFRWVPGLDSDGADHRLVARRARPDRGHRDLRHAQRRHDSRPGRTSGSATRPDGHAASTATGIDYALPGVRAGQTRRLGGGRHRVGRRHGRRSRSTSSRRSSSSRRCASSAPPARPDTCDIREVEPGHVVATVDDLGAHEGVSIEGTQGAALARRARRARRRRATARRRRHAARCAPAGAAAGAMAAWPPCRPPCSCAGPDASRLLGRRGRRRLRRPAARRDRPVADRARAAPPSRRPHRCPARPHRPRPPAGGRRAGPADPRARRPGPRVPPPPGRRRDPGRRRRARADGDDRVRPAVGRLARRTAASSCARRCATSTRWRGSSRPPSTASSSSTTATGTRLTRMAGAPAAPDQQAVFAPDVHVAARPSSSARTTGPSPRAGATLGSQLSAWRAAIGPVGHPGRRPPDRRHWSLGVVAALAGAVGACSPAARWPALGLGGPAVAGAGRGRRPAGGRRASPPRVGGVGAAGAHGRRLGAVAAGRVVPPVPGRVRGLPRRRGRQAGRAARVHGVGGGGRRDRPVDARPSAPRPSPPRSRACTTPTWRPTCSPRPRQTATAPSSSGSGAGSAAGSAAARSAAAPAAGAAAAGSHRATTDARSPDDGAVDRGRVATNRGTPAVPARGRTRDRPSDRRAARSLRGDRLQHVQAGGPAGGADGGQHAGQGADHQHDGQRGRRARRRR